MPDNAKDNWKLVAPMGFVGGFTVLMAVYARDNPTLFKDAVESVLLNTLQANCFLIVVDGPIPPEIENVIASALGNPVVQVLRLEKNGGLANALNAGLENIKTTWTVRADADDINLLNRFSTLAEYASSNPEITLIGSQIVETEPDGSVVGVRHVPTKQADIIRFVKSRNPFNHMTVAVRTETVKQLGGYPHIYLREDYGLWAKIIAAKCAVANHPDVLVRATAGRDMFRRRGGFRYALGEIEMQRFLYGLRLKGWLEAVLHGIARSAVFLLPNEVRAFIYTKLLRRQSN